MKCAGLAIACLILSATALWAAEAVTGETPAAPELVQGTVTGENVYIRPTPATDAQNYIYKAYKNDKLVVLGKKGAWYRVKVPRFLRLWVDEKFVKLDEANGAATLNSDRVNLRGGPGMEYEVIGQLGAGASFLIDRKFEGYVCLKPTLDAEGFISDKYLTIPSGTQVQQEPGGETAEGPDAEKTASRPASVPVNRDAEADKRVTDIGASLDAEMKKAEGKRDLLPLMEELVKISKTTKDPLVRGKIRMLYGQYLNPTKNELALKAQQEQVAVVNKGLAEIQEKYAKENEKIVAPADLPVAKGIVEKLYYKSLPAATHKLVQGERVPYLLFSTEHDLDKLVGKEVAVYGPVTHPEGFPSGVGLVEVKRLMVMENPPK